MQPRIYWIVACATAIVIAGCNAAATNEKEQSGKERSAGSSAYNSFSDDLYLDDQDNLEGSGRGGGEVRDDLEASGSGLGPDDEDGDGDRDFNNHIARILPEQKPAKPNTPYVEDPHKTHDTEDLPPKRPDIDENLTPHREELPEEEEDQDNTHEVLIMNPKQEDRASSFFAQPGVLAAVIGGAVVGLLCAILVVMFIVYRMRKKDEGSYALDEPRRSPATAAYPKPGAPHHNREFYA